MRDDADEVARPEAAEALPGQALPERDLRRREAEDRGRRLHLGPVVAAIFANSPLVEGKLSGYKSTRYAVWLETDPDRTGLSPAAIEDEFSIERFIEYLSRVPMLFIRRDGQYIDMTGRSFAQFLRNGAARAAVPKPASRRRPGS